jgi:predicted CXXCH cytochrome family protein
MAAFTTTAVFGADVKDGQAVYDKSCKSCHGADGTPNPAIVKMMKVDIKDLKSTDAHVKKVVAGIRALTVEVGHNNGPAETVYRRIGLAEAADRQLLALALAAPTHIV